ncbi:hypothetical protein FISHEDRAFT_32189 [Fistulina hepatica ATCC 64428]|uniref:B30.2/SPRY domain-containing protein n=1 Tax=Fistulina hepatica ATCC 64428 TaxID=1128425 RepID=A0A0D7AQJ3_9AGAR|nr:hypothetical protein FISHEDRAFT_32189 [Fistulina hepatica ATCC 64428]
MRRLLWISSKSEPSQAVAKGGTKHNQAFLPDTPSRLSSRKSESPPKWQAAAGQSHYFGRFTEADHDDYRSAEAFCEASRLEDPKLFSPDSISLIQTLGCRAWALEEPDTQHFQGHIYNLSGKSDSKNTGASVIGVQTSEQCRDSTILSNFPIIAGKYDTRGKSGAYFEIRISAPSTEGVIAIGMACKPYPSWRLPGWNRMSAALHLDDYRKFFENPDGGMDHDSCGRLRPDRALEPGETIGCGYEFATNTFFFTYNGDRFPAAFTGIYPPGQHDVYAALGVDGTCDFEVNFGGDSFAWQPANEWDWRADNIGLPTGSGSVELPSYDEVVQK